MSFFVDKIVPFFQSIPRSKTWVREAQRAQAATTQQVEILLSIFGSASVTGQMSTWVSPPLWAKYIHKNEWVALLLIENLHFWRKFHIFGITVKMKLGISGTILKNVTQPLLTLLISLLRTLPNPGSSTKTELRTLQKSWTPNPWTEFDPTLV